MRLITLNCWGGRRIEPLIEFFSREVKDCDIFCLQEVFDADQAVLDAKHPESPLRGDLFRLIAATLGDHVGYFARFEDPDRMSTAIFVRKTLAVMNVWDAVVYRPTEPVETGKAIISPRKLQCVTVGYAGAELLVANLHGLWCLGPKTDTPERLEQSRCVRRVLDAHRGPSVLAGDFNLLPDTESVCILAEGRRELVSEHAVDSTRTPLYRHYDDPAEPNYADYVILSSDLEVDEFRVLPDEVSDHAPLSVTFR